jgi:large subunit ribosomal protein L18
VRLQVSKSNSQKLKSRSVKRVKIRKKIKGTAMRPRLCVYRSLKNVSVQLIDDEVGKTIVAVSTQTDIKGKTGKDAAFEVGKLLASKAKEKNIEKIVFDRSGYLFHGRIKAIADGARDGGLNF